MDDGKQRGASALEIVLMLAAAFAVTLALFLLGFRILPG